MDDTEIRYALVIRHDGFQVWSYKGAERLECMGTGLTLLEAHDCLSELWLAQPELPWLGHADDFHSWEQELTDALF